MKRLVNDLKRLDNGKSLSKSSISKLKDLKLIKKKVKTESKYSVPNSAPRWASKYNFTRKKYNVTEEVTTIVEYQITKKGRNLIKRTLNGNNNNPQEENKDVDPGSDGDSSEESET